MRQALSYEFVRLRTLRSTWWLLGSALALQFLVAFLYAGKTDMTPRERFVGTFSGLPLLLVTLLTAAVGVAAFGHEYRYRTIATTTLTLRSPAKILAAKALSIVAVTAGTAVGMVGVTLIAESLRGGVPSELWRVGQVLAAVAVFAVLCGLVGLGVAAVTRNAVIAIVTVLAFPTIVETLLAAGLDLDSRLLPFQSAMQLVKLQEDGTAWTLPLPLLALAVLLLATGGMCLPGATSESEGRTESGRPYRADVARTWAPSLSWWDGSARNLILDLALVCGVGFVGWQQSWTSATGVLPYGAGTAVAVTGVAAAFLFRRRFPHVVLAVAALGLVLVGMLLHMCLACYTVANRHGNGPATWVAAAASSVAVVVPWGRASSLDELTLAAPLAIAVVGVPVLLGLWVGQRQQLVDSLRERAEQAERERDLRAANAVAEERTRIARELHDVVAHRISQIAILTGALAVSPNGKSADVAEIIRGTSTAALEEMRELLGVLRRGQADAPLRPAPTLEGLNKLVGEAAATGQRVRVNLPDRFPTVPGTVGRAIYRLVQESLTNAAKHAPGAEVHLDLGVQDNGELTVAVHNTPGLPPALRTTHVVESGYGLAGMRERVELAGGNLTAGPGTDGGFHTTAHFPKVTP